MPRDPSNPVDRLSSLLNVRPSSNLEFWFPEETNDILAPTSTTFSSNACKMAETNASIVRNLGRI